jgi:hypothetical protein
MLDSIFWTLSRAHRIEYLVVQLLLAVALAVSRTLPRGDAQKTLCNHASDVSAALGHAGSGASRPWKAIESILRHSPFFDRDVLAHYGLVLGVVIWI